MRFKRALLIFSGATFLGICFAAQAYLNYALSGQNIPFVRMLTWELPGWYTWAALYPLIFRLAGRFPLDRKNWPVNFPLHILFSIPVSLIQLAIHASLSWLTEYTLLGYSYPLFAMAKANFFSRITWRIMVYFILLIAGHAAAWYRRSNALENQLARAQLQALRMQLHPHFLFNTLQSVTELMHQDLQAADEMMVRLADFLRLTLESDGAQEVPLEKEMLFIRGYLDIQQVRFKDRLRVSIEVDSQSAGAIVPNLVLQPIVENAIRHGIAPQSSPASIVITAKRAEDRLVLEVKDTGVGLREGVTTNGLGLANTRARLAQLYGEDFQLNLNNGPEGGTVAILKIPFRRST